MWPSSFGLGKLSSNSPLHHTCMHGFQQMDIIVSINCQPVWTWAVPWRCLWGIILIDWSRKTQLCCGLDCFLSRWSWTVYSGERDKLGAVVMTFSPLCGCPSSSCHCDLVTLRGCSPTVSQSATGEETRAVDTRNPRQKDGGHAKKIQAEDGEQGPAPWLSSSRHSLSCRHPGLKQSLVILTLYFT